MAHKVTHLDSSESFTRPKILINNVQKPRNWSQSIDPAIEAFHKALPDYAETQLHSLPDMAAELGFSHVFVKDESTRFGLPAFKILGASWAIHQSICKRIGLPKTASLEELIQALKQRDDIHLVTCTEGNWGRACARMAKYLGIPCKIYVPYFMNEYTQRLLRGEGAEVVLLENGSYDDSIAAVRKEASGTEALMVLDTSWDGFSECPQVLSMPTGSNFDNRTANATIQWVTDGYSTMLAETTRQVASCTGKSSPPTLAFVSVGVGSWAHSVVSYYKSASSSNQTMSVEPTAAPSFKESLHCGNITPIATGETIMNGMNCGTTSMIAWPEMRDGMAAAVTVEDREAHRDVEFLKRKGVNAGPCGAATLAALRATCQAADQGEVEGLGLQRREREGKVVLLFSTEGGREYEIPE